MVLDFVRFLGRELDEKTRYSLLRATPDGLFLSEEARAPFSAAVESFLRSQKLDSSPEGRLLRGAAKATGAASYLLDGKVCLFGSLLPVSLTERDTSQLPFWRGSLFDASDYLHLKDPIFRELKEAEATLGSGGFQMKVLSRKKPASVSLEVLTQFCRTAKNSKTALSEEPRLENALRWGVPLLVKLWAKAKVARHSDRLFVPLAHEGERSLTYLLFKDLVWVQDRSGALIRSYGLRGKNLHQLLQEETDALRRKSKGKPVRGLQLRERGRQLGSLRLEKETVLIERGAFKRFFDRIPYSRDLPKKPPARYSLRFALESFCELVWGSIWVDQINVPKEFLRQVDRKMNFRARKNWYFAITSRFHITDCFDANDRRGRKRSA